MSETLFSRTLRGLFRLTHGRFTLPDAHDIAGPCVIVCHHDNMRGPVYSAAYLPPDLRPWVLSAFCERRSCRVHFLNNTFTARFGWPRLLARPVSRVLSWIVPGLMRAGHAIPVWRGSPKLRETFRISVDTLLAGGRIVLFPDIQYTKNEVSELYNGFVMLEKLYFRRCGRHIRFIPVVVSRKTRTLYASKPVYFTSECYDAKEAEEVLLRIRQALADLTHEC